MIVAFRTRINAPFFVLYILLPYHNLESDLNTLDATEITARPQNVTRKRQDQDAGTTCHGAQQAASRRAGAEVYRLLSMGTDAVHMLFRG